MTYDLIWPSVLKKTFDIFFNKLCKNQILNEFNFELTDFPEGPQNISKYLFLF